MTPSIPDENKTGAPMREHYVTPRHLSEMETIATASSAAPGKTEWTVLSLHYRAGFNRSYVAVVQGVSLSKPLRFRFMAAGTLDRAIGWFDTSDLRSRLEVMAAQWAERRDDQQHIEAVRSDRVEFVDGQWRIDGEIYISELEATQRGRIPLMAPGEHLIIRHVGITTDRLTDALAWLYPDATSAAARCASIERDFGMPARTARRALQIEANPVEGQEQGAWVGMFLKAMECFDRELWAAGQATIANVES